MRRYAAFFEWYDRGPKELGVVECLAAALSQARGRALHSLREHNPDPPDCVAETTDAQPVAVEVAEVVCETAARLNARGQGVYRVWRSGELAAHVAREIQDKDGKTFHGGPYSEVVACLFTDEPALTFEFALNELMGRTFGPVSTLTSAYLLFSYDPHRKSYPVIPLTLHHDA